MSNPWYFADVCQNSYMKESITETRMGFGGLVKGVVGGIRQFTVSKLIRS